MIGMGMWATVNNMILFIHIKSHMWHPGKMKRPKRPDISWTRC